MLNDIQVKKMLSLQDSMNSKVNTNWKTLNNDWLLAASLEAAEAIEHHGWKWWKKQTPDLPQLRMELVDIWHFALSYAIIEAKPRTGMDELEILTMCENQNILFDFTNYKFRTQTLLQNLKLLMATTAANVFEPALFYFICHQARFPLDELYKQYVGKNVLNFFRQDYGYKDGTYMKVWNGKEDNVHLVELLKRLSLDDPQIDKKLYKSLERRYIKLGGTS